MRTSGTFLCLASGTAFGAMAVLAKLAYDAGATVGTLLSARFALAALLFWALVLLRDAHGVRNLARRDVGAGLALGACGYAVQAGCFFTSLRRMDASLATLVVYVFPSLVAVAAIALGRERLDCRRPVALVLATGGLALLLAGARAGAVDPTGTALAVAAAIVYSAYILAGEGIASRVGPLTLSALVCTGAAASFTLGSALLGDLHPGRPTLAGWGTLACLAVVSTVAAISLFFAGLVRVGPSTASILATVEPVVGTLLAVVVLGETLSPLQLAGGGLVLLAVPVLHVRRRRRGRRERAQLSIVA